MSWRGTGGDFVHALLFEGGAPFYRHVDVDDAKVSRFIRWPDHEDDDWLGTSLPDDAAALDHAIRIVRELRQGGEHNHPGLMMIVRNETLKTVLSLPFHAGCA